MQRYATGSVEMSVKNRMTREEFRKLRLKAMGPTMPKVTLKRLVYSPHSFYWSLAEFKLSDNTAAKASAVADS